MITPLIDESVIKRLRRLLEEAERVVITCHMSPDGDAMGSSLGLARVLEAVGKDVKVITPDMPPKYLMFLPGADEIVVYSKYEEFANELIASAQLIFCLDYNELHRIDRLAEPIAQSTAPRVLIDHHTNPGDFAELKISYPLVSSTSMLVFRTLCRLELFPLIDKAAAECIYTGMMTDTGNFAYNSNDPDLYIVVSELLKKGINKDEIYNRVYKNNTVDRLRLNGFAVYEKMEIIAGGRAAVISLSRDELNRFNYKRGDTEDLVNRPLTVPEIVVSAFLREEDGYVKISTRSKGSVPVNELCSRHFGGGGHLNAAGGELHEPLDDVIAKVKLRIEQMLGAAPIDE